jgi:hypothetical protein
MRDFVCRIWYGLFLFLGFGWYRNSSCLSSSVNANKAKSGSSILSCKNLISSINFCIVY